MFIFVLNALNSNRVLAFRPINMIFDFELAPIFL